jgi:shikimate kinase
MTGSGKSSVGQAMAAHTGDPSLDSSRPVEDAARLAVVDVLGADRKAGLLVEKLWNAYW